MDILNRSVQKTNTWIKDAGQALNWKDEHKSYTALRAVLHAVRDQLNLPEGLGHFSKPPGLPKQD
jgi:uncharacterized protein (DUF2267 family)